MQYVLLIWCLGIVEEKCNAKEAKKGTLAYGLPREWCP
jgi:hypothetical protein